MRSCRIKITSSVFNRPYTQSVWHAGSTAKFTSTGHIAEITEAVLLDAAEGNGAHGGLGQATRGNKEQTRVSTPPSIALSLGAVVSHSGESLPQKMEL